MKNRTSINAELCSHGEILSAYPTTVRLTTIGQYYTLKELITLYTR